MSNPTRWFRRSWALLVLFGVTLEGPARADILNPLDYASLGVLPSSTGGSPYQITDGPTAPTLSNGITTFQGVYSNGYAVFDFNSIQLAGTDSISVSSPSGSPSPGSALLSRGDASVGNVSVDYLGYGPQQGPGAGQPGQQAFGYQIYHYSGGGGGGYGTPGTQGYSVNLTLPNGNQLYIPGGAGGPAYGNQPDTVTWGSGGGNGLGAIGGGPGGGLMQISALGQVSITGILSANGLSGIGSGEGSGGGGSGGGILVAGSGVSLLGGIFALGGGSGGPGGGGGGRVAIWTGPGGFSGDPSAIQAGIVTFSTIPEPSSCVLLGVGLVALLGASRRFKNR